ncbi:hypothetical protein [Marinibactrum halimedae]|uniref:Uncharacterized protein n=1 Tax=Marinibactrum halimedae TaxID=1444977 RepID=A0AA37T8Q4_9GAMM|nr:hypothetical protein [Marinibactrum halimedae]MCD9457440.1 hypothetical protein [Marinibactrum halimedae]GLS25510.1 hypothetical protein GCM10007877_12240 [Marinibactrum halimedae]
MTEIALWLLLQIGIEPTSATTTTSEITCPEYNPNGGTGGVDQPDPN